jgi:hypothetical protein
MEGGAAKKKNRYKGESRLCGVPGWYGENWELTTTHTAFVCVLYTEKSEAFAGVRSCPWMGIGKDAACGSVSCQAGALG